jgi:site-specific DNA-cytosine methylase
MNNRKKTVEQQGESGATFMAIRKYAELHKPRMIIFENVLKAPWDKLKNWMYESGYASRWVRVDTKAYSLPETRIRGYMLCIHMGEFPETSKKLEYLLDDWLRLFKELGRRASVPFETFLLSPDDPRLDMTQVDELNDQKNTPWVKCKQRHVDTREDLDLGNGRPITDWNEDGSYTVPDFHKYVKGFTQRVSDTIDIAHLRNISRGIDDRYYRYF